LDARLIGPPQRALVPARALLDGLLARCRDHADSADAVHLDRVPRLAVANGADRQRAWVDENGLDALLPMLSRRFARLNRRPQRAAAAAPAPAGIRWGASSSGEPTERNN
jgi:hypothetical protein